MLDSEAIKHILEAENTEKRVFCIGLARLVSKKLKSVRILAKNGHDFSDYGADSQNISLWLYENFPRLEETAINDTKTLLRMGRLLGRRGVPMFFEVFSRVVFTLSKLDEKQIDEIICECGNFGKGLDLVNGRSLVLLFRVAVCVRLCDCFVSASGDGGDGRDLLCEIEGLFSTLDVLLGFDDERALKNNPVERVLMTDPDMLYNSLTRRTKASYRNNLSRIAKRTGKTEIETAKSIVKICENGRGDEHHIGAFLVDKPCGGKTYLFLLAFLTLLFTTLLCIISPVFLFSVFSVYGCTKLILDKIFLKFIVKDFCVPCIELSAIPEGSGVLVAFVSLINGSKTDEEIFGRLEKAYHSNGGENVYFALLCDLPESTTKMSDKDREILDYANKRISLLRKKYSDCFYLFVREREYCENEKMYMAPERKRGAVNALVSFLCEKSDLFCMGSIKPDEKTTGNIKYVMTLDSDTNMEFDCLKKMTGIMLHPQNRPTSDRKKAIVTKGYGILQPRMNPTLESAGRSVFSSVMCGRGGVEGYTHARNDVAMSLFGRSIFCGKGMFDKNCYYDVLCSTNEFSANTILSHDAPEGARLCCASISDITFTDSFPREEMSYFKRLHRWVRGDVQNIGFLLPKVKTSDGNKIENHIRYSSRFFILHNVLSALMSVFTPILIIISCFCEKTVSSLAVTLALSLYILPFVYSVFALPKIRLWQNIRIKYHSRGIHSGIQMSFVRMLLVLSMAVKEAYVCGDAVIRSAYRSLVSRKKMLEWTTAAQNDKEKSDGLLGYVRKNLLSAFVGAMLFVLSENGFVKLVALVFFFLPVIAYQTGKERKHKTFVPSKKQVENVKKHCGDIWNFFSENVSDKTSFLPTDNIAFYPEKKMSRMTSPTNIGMYLLSVLCARRIGFIDSREMERRLFETLLSVSRLENFDGLLYNWYDIFLMKPMSPMYVSSVDVGNYAACLICVIEAIDEYKDEMPNYDRVKELLKVLLDNCDFYRLYDNEKNLFYIGGVYENGNFTPDKNHYDMLVSEARILSFTAVATRKVPAVHYKKLSRAFVRNGFFAGLASWSGTMFEYFMPEIFFPSPDGSVVYEALCFSFYEQIKKSVCKDDVCVFGISESCYNELDDAANYKYHAFGIPETALDVVEKQNVISPYSSFLCLSFAPRKALSNLENLEKLGTLGEYGFYESIDFERCEMDKDFGLVRCFMSHHLGMSLASGTNFLCDGAVSGWFSKNKSINSALELNAEQIPFDAYVRRTPRRHYKCSKNAKDARTLKKSTSSLHTSVTDGRMCIKAKKGKVEIKYGEIYPARRKSFEDSLCAFRVWIEVDGEEFLFDTKACLLSEAGRIRFLQKFRKSTGESFEASLSFTIVRNTADTVRAEIKLRQFYGRKDMDVVYKVGFYPLLDVKKNANTCSFFDASDEAFCMPYENEVYFRRNSENICFFAGAVKGAKKRANVENGCITLSCVPNEENMAMTAEFAISISESKMCAQMGLARCTEKGFDEACLCLDERKTSEKTRRISGKRPERSMNVLGCSMVKEKTDLSFPLDSREKPYHLISTKEFSLLVHEKNLGTSFVYDINKKRMTAFSGTKDYSIFGERIVFAKDGFELCKNATETEFFAHSAVYKGFYGKARYRTCVLVPKDLPCKVICVDSEAGDSVNLEIIPDDIMNCQRHIGSGLVFFGKENASLEKGFAFGYRISKDNGIRGAEYDMSDVIRLCFGNEDDKDSTWHRYVFCIGFATEQKAFEIWESIVKTDFETIEKESMEFFEAISFDKEKMPSNIISVLEKYFVFPKSTAMSRAFVKTNNHLYLFDSLLLVYTCSEYKHKRADEVALVRPYDELSKLMICIFVSEYFKENNDRDFLEITSDGNSLYRRCLAYLLDGKDKEKLSDLYALCLELFEDVCMSVCDVRTAGELHERRKKIQMGTDGGIFL